MFQFIGSYMQHFGQIKSVPLCFFLKFGLNKFGLNKFGLNKFGWLRPNLDSKCNRKMVRFFIPLILGLTIQPAFAAPYKLTDFDTNFDTNVRNLSSDAVRQDFLWGYSQAEMTQQFIDHLKQRIIEGKDNNNNTISATGLASTTDGESRIVNISGNLGSANVYMKIWIEFGGGKIIEAYPSANQSSITHFPLDHAANSTRLTALNINSATWLNLRKNFALVKRDGVSFSYCREPFIEVHNGVAVQRQQVCKQNQFGYVRFDNGDNFIPRSQGRRALVNSLPARATNKARLHIFNVDSGNCSLLICPSASKAMIFDCGTSSGGGTSFSKLNVFGFDLNKQQSGFVPNRVVTLLHQEKIDEIDLVVSHADGDHFSLIAPILNHDRLPTNLELRNVYLGTSMDFDDLDKGSTGEFGAGIKDLKTLLIAKAKKIYADPRDDDGGIARRHDRSATDPGIFLADRFSSRLPSAGTASASADATGFCGIDIKFVAANETQDGSTKKNELKNAKSVITKIGGKIMLTADAQTNALKKAATSLAGVNVLTVPHHGSRGAIHRPNEWMTGITGLSHLIYQAGNGHGHPEVNTWNGAGQQPTSTTPLQTYNTKLSDVPNATKNAYFASFGAGLAPNAKMAVQTSKSVHISSDSGELVIDNIEGAPSLMCLGPFKEAVNAGPRTLGQVFWDNRNCLPAGFRTYLTAAGQGIPAMRP